MKVDSKHVIYRLITWNKSKKFFIYHITRIILMQYNSRIHTTNDMIDGLRKTKNTSVLRQLGLSIKLKVMLFNILLLFDYMQMYHLTICPWDKWIFWEFNMVMFSCPAWIVACNIVYMKTMCLLTIIIEFTWTVCWVWSIEEVIWKLQIHSGDENVMLYKI